MRFLFGVILSSFLVLNCEASTPSYNTTLATYDQSILNALVDYIPNDLAIGSYRDSDEQTNYFGFFVAEANNTHSEIYRVPISSFNTSTPTLIESIQKQTSSTDLTSQNHYGANNFVTSITIDDVSPVVANHTVYVRGGNVSVNSVAGTAVPVNNVNSGCAWGYVKKTTNIYSDTGGLTAVAAYGDQVASACPGQNVGGNGNSRLAFTRLGNAKPRLYAFDADDSQGLGKVIFAYDATNAQGNLQASPANIFYQDPNHDGATTDIGNLNRVIPNKKHSTATQLLIVGDNGLAIRDATTYAEKVAVTGTDYQDAWWDTSSNKIYAINKDAQTIDIYVYDDNVTLAKQTAETGLSKTVLDAVMPMAQSSTITGIPGEAIFVLGSNQTAAPVQAPTKVYILKISLTPSTTEILSPGELFEFVDIGAVAVSPTVDFSLISSEIISAATIERGSLISATFDISESQIISNDSIGPISFLPKRSLEQQSTLLGNRLNIPKSGITFASKRTASQSVDDLAHYAKALDKQEIKKLNHSVWVSAFHNTSKNKETLDQNPSTSHLNGATVGYEYREKNKQYIAGINISGGVGANTRDDNETDGTRHRFLQAGVYSSVRVGKSAYHVDFFTGVGQAYSRAKRSVPSTTKIAYASIKSTNINVGGQLNYSRKMFSPFVGLSYIHSKTDAYKETGAGTHNMVQDARKINILNTYVGIGCRKSFVAWDDNWISVQGKFKYAYTPLRPHQRLETVKFEGLNPNSLTLDVPSMNAVAYNFSGTILVSNRKTYETSLTFSGTIEKKRKAAMLSLTQKWYF